jgi:hypothetical protein
MGIAILIWVLIAVISVLAIYHKNKVRQNEQQERERQRQEWKELEDRVKEQDREVKKTIRKAKKAMEKAMLNDMATKRKFDPRITTTYQYTDYNKQLVIDGIPIYRYERDAADRFIKKPVDEGNFVSFTEFRLKGAPDYQTVNGYQTYLNDYIQWEADRCNKNRTENIFGGYLFTDAMVELSARCTKEQKEKIGKIMVDYRKGGIRTSRLKQMLWDENTGVDNYLFTAIVRIADFQEEQDLMADYFQESEFETEAEALEYLNASKYLNKYPRLKEQVIQDVIRSLSN